MPGDILDQQFTDFAGPTGHHDGPDGDYWDGLEDDEQYGQHAKDVLFGTEEADILSNSQVPPSVRSQGRTTSPI